MSTSRPSRARPVSRARPTHCRSTRRTGEIDGGLDLRSISRAALVTAAALALPIAFHALRLGHVFLPMYLPILAGACFLRPGWAAAERRRVAAGLCRADRDAAGLPAGRPLDGDRARGDGLADLDARPSAGGFRQRSRSPWRSSSGAASTPVLIFATGRWLELPAGMLTLVSLVAGWPGMLLAITDGAARRDLAAPRGGDARERQACSLRGSRAALGVFPAVARGRGGGSARSRSGRTARRRCGRRRRLRNRGRARPAAPAARPHGPGAGDRLRPGDGRHRPRPASGSAGQLALRRRARSRRARGFDRRPALFRHLAALPGSPAGARRRSRRWLAPGGRLLVWHDIGRERLAAGPRQGRAAARRRSPAAGRRARAARDLRRTAGGTSGGRRELLHLPRQPPTSAAEPVATRCDPRSALALALCGGAAGMAGARSAACALGLLVLWLAVAVPGARRRAWRLLPLLSGLSILVLLLPWAPRAAGSALLRGAATSLAVAGATMAAGGVALTSALAACRSSPHSRRLSPRARPARRRHARGGLSRLPRARPARWLGPLARSTPRHGRPARGRSRRRPSPGPTARPRRSRCAGSKGGCRRCLGSTPRPVSASGDSRPRSSEWDSGRSCRGAAEPRGRRPAAIATPARPATRPTALSFRLAPGERGLLLGPNGSGKSTLLARLVGLLDGPGEIRIGEQLLSRRTLRTLRRRTGFLWQRPDDGLLLPTVREDVALGPANDGLAAESEAIAERWLERLGISHLAERRIRELSLGERQLVALAGVLARDPGLLLLDEPIAALDSSARAPARRAFSPRSPRPCSSRPTSPATGSPRRVIGDPPSCSTDQASSTIRASRHETAHRRDESPGAAS